MTEAKRKLWVEVTKKNWLPPFHRDSLRRARAAHVVPFGLFSIFSTVLRGCLCACKFPGAAPEPWVA